MPYDQGAYRQNRYVRPNRTAGWGGGGGTPTYGGGGGQGGGGNMRYTAAQQAQAVAIPPLEISAQRDPNLDRYMAMFESNAGEYDTMRKELAEGTDQDAVNAMMRQRDLTSGMAKEAYEGRALASGGDSGLANRARSQVLVSGARDASGLNANLAASSRQMQLNALQGKTGAIAGGAGVAGNSAQALLGQQNHALNAWQAQRAAQQAANDSQMQREQMMWDRQMQLANMMYTG